MVIVIVIMIKITAGHVHLRHEHPVWSRVGDGRPLQLKLHQPALGALFIYLFFIIIIIIIIIIIEQHQNYK